MSTSKKRRDEFHTEHLVPGKDKRAERRVKDALKRAQIFEPDDWDDLNYNSVEPKFKKNQKLD